MIFEAASDAAAAPRNRRKQTASSIAFLVHLATGLWLTVLLAVVMVTGTIAVLFAEIDWLIYPEMRVAPVESRVNSGVFYDSVRAAYPEVGVHSLQTAALQDRTAASAFVAVPGGVWSGASSPVRSPLPISALNAAS